MQQTSFRHTQQTASSDEPGLIFAAGVLLGKCLQDHTRGNCDQYAGLHSLPVGYSIHRQPM